jgi:hypothetical protein
MKRVGMQQSRHEISAATADRGSDCAIIDSLDTTDARTTVAIRLYCCALACLQRASDLQDRTEKTLPGLGGGLGTGT